LEWQTGADGPTLSLAVAIRDVDPGVTLEVSLTAIAGEESDALYSASGTADSSGSVSLEAVVPVPSDASRASLVVTNAADDREVARTSISIPTASQTDSSSASINGVVASAASSLDSYWEGELRAAGIGGTSAPKVVAYDSGLGQLPPPCRPADDIDALVNNAFYCKVTNEIAWDRNLMRQIYPEFGPYAVAGVIAHEWAHWVQEEMGGIPRRTAERHADCLAGVWAKVEELDSTNEPELSPSDRADALVALDWHSTPSPGQAVRPQPNPRFAAFLRGIRDGLFGCERYAAEDH
jgi:predicted metalloprotease